MSRDDRGRSVPRDHGDTTVFDVPSRYVWLLGAVAAPTIQAASCFASAVLVATSGRSILKVLAWVTGFVMEPADS